ncbi:MAG: hypothetical protein H8F28_03750 [Fibrella sp.]|nr:hypothetical protein [Armatimonadota bacterium]
MPEPLIVPIVAQKFLEQPAAVAALPRKETPTVVRFVVADTAILTRLYVYERSGNTWRLIGDGEKPRTVRSGQAGLAIAPAVATRSGPQIDHFTVSLENPDGKPLGTLLCRVAPVLLASSLDPVVRVFVVKSTLSEKFVGELSRLLSRCEGKPSLVAIEPVSVPHDLWMQDTTEIGVCAVPDGRSVKQIPVPLGGLRGKHEGIKTDALDQTVRDYFARDPQYVPVQAAESRPNTRWIDWYGNLEVSPPVPGYPHGRVLTGFQKELRFHPDLIAFLEAQELQCPPLYLDVSWLTIGHVDELINFVPARGSGKGFRALLPSPQLAKSLLEKAVKGGHGDVEVFAGTKQETTVSKLLNEVADTEESRLIESSLIRTRKTLASELDLSPNDIISLPVLFKEGLAVIPNGVNSLIVGRDVIIPAPNGPKIGTTDLFEAAIRERLEPLGLRLHFVDIHEPYHVRSGEIHCGTNAVRRLKNPRWWSRSSLPRLP